MKKNVLALGALLFAVILSSFTHQKFADVYFVYGKNTTGSTDEKDKASYTFQTSSPGDKSGSTYIAWFKGAAATPSAPTVTEFETSFELIDGDRGGSDNDILSDETNENTDEFEKRDAIID